MANPSRIRRDHNVINLDTHFSCRNEVSSFNDFGEPEKTNTAFRRWGKRLSDGGDEIDLGSGEGLRVVTGKRVMVRYDSVFDLNVENTLNFITIDGAESQIEKIELLDRKRWMILVAEAST